MIDPRSLRVFARTFLVVCTVLGAVSAVHPSTYAASALVAVTGDLQPGESGARLLGVSAATLNASGQIAFRATLQPGVGSVDSTNDRAIWRIRGAIREVLAQAGVGDVPSGGSFNDFQAVSISDNGEAMIRASVVGGQVGLWRYSAFNGVGTTIAATGVANIPGLLDARFDTIGFELMHAPGDVVAFNGRLQSGFGGVNNDNDQTLWLDDLGQQSLLVRENGAPAPDVGGAPFRTPTAVSVNDQGQTAVVGTLVEGGGVNSSNSHGIWRLSATDGDLVARRGVGNVAGVPGASYSAFVEPVINDAGQIAFRADLNIGGSITLANSRGLWLHDGPDGALLVQSSGPAANVAGATFDTFGSPLLNDDGKVLFAASLVQGVGGVTSQNDDGLWIAGSQGQALIARTGSGGVPDVPGASFSSFNTLAFNEFDFAAVHANLSGVAPGTGEGIWILTGLGEGLLVARAGDVVGSRTIATLDFEGGSGGGDGRQRVLTSSGQLLYKATFTNGDEGLFLFTPSFGSSADFNFDTNVDGADLFIWRQNFGQPSGSTQATGDADTDSDVDGNDFLFWQRQLGASVVPAAVPEPSLGALLLPVVVGCVLRFSRGARSVR